MKLELNETEIQELIREVFSEYELVDKEHEYLTVCHVSSPEWGCTSYLRLDDDIDFNNTDVLDWCAKESEKNLESFYSVASSEVKQKIKIICQNIIDEDEFDYELRGELWELRIYPNGKYNWVNYR